MTKNWDKIKIKRIDNIRHKTDDNSKNLVKEYDKKSVQYLQDLDSFAHEHPKACFSKYMDLEAGIISLQQKKLRFVEPTRWEDKYEGRFYTASYDSISSNQEDTPLLYACCMTHKPNNEAAWKIYSYGKTGLGAHCVQFKLNRFNLRMQLAKSPTVKTGYTIVEGKVSYHPESIINKLHMRSIKTSTGKMIDNPNFLTFFDSFNLLKYINLLLLKRDYFKYENEVRFFIIPNDVTNTKAKLKQKGGIKVYGDTFDVDIDWSTIIEEIRIDAKCTELEYKIFKDVCLSLLTTENSKDNSQQSPGKEYDKLIEKFTPKKIDLYGKKQQIKIIPR